MKESPVDGAFLSMSILYPENMNNDNIKWLNVIS